MTSTCRLGEQNTATSERSPSPILNITLNYSANLSFLCLILYCNWLCVQRVLIGELASIPIQQCLWNNTLTNLHQHLKRPEISLKFSWLYSIVLAKDPNGNVLLTNVCGVAVPIQRIPTGFSYWVRVRKIPNRTLYLPVSKLSNHSSSRLPGCSTATGLEKISYNTTAHSRIRLSKTGRWILITGSEGSSFTVWLNFVNSDRSSLKGWYGFWYLKKDSCRLLLYRITNLHGVLVGSFKNYKQNRT